MTPTVPVTGMGFDDELFTVTLPDTVVDPVTGTGFAGVLTTVTGADGGTCAAARASVGNNRAAAPAIFKQLSLPHRNCMAFPPWKYNAVGITFDC
jgi:hypothetical protein